METVKIAIDGPSGAGKSTLARETAKKLGYLYIDTGAMYRAIGLYVRRRNIGSRDRDGIVKCLPEIRIGLKHCQGIQHVYLNGEDVSEAIRTPEISRYASDVSAFPEVRAFLLELQRDLAREHHVVMDGRDIGTVVLPEAQVKIFLTASAEERARRRYEELVQKDPGITYEQILKEIKARDHNDTTRTEAPLRQAEDAILLDTTGNELSDSIALIEKTVKERLAACSTELSM